MARKKRTSKLRPKTPKRVKSRRQKPRGHQHPELIGLGLAALGLFLATVLYLGWRGGVVGEAVADGFRAVIGEAVYAAPLALVGVGALMLARSRLVDLRPFKTGLAVFSLGLMLMLGELHGGLVGGVLEGLVGGLLGEIGVSILGSTLAVAGTLLLTGASVGAVVRRSGHAVRRSGHAMRQSGRAVRRAG
ncbi:MAG: hypothetical protein M3321_08915, partial [Actinomycetota bacterium]|nr:hypothetical protein [Actinomycetota bacterium]